MNRLALSDLAMYNHEPCTCTYRWFKVWGVSIASERKMRERAKDLVGDHLLAEKAPFSFTLKDGGEEIRCAPYANLWDKVTSMLDQCER